MANPTPGPWKAHPIETGHGLPYTPVAASTLLAKVYSTAYGDHAQSEANGRLMAAAPDMLAALRYAVDNPEFDSAEFDRLARSALAKAAGSAS